MKRFVLVAVLCAAGLVHAEEAGKIDPFTGGSAEAGAAKSATCTACHGPGGNSANPEWPKLAGQHAPYVARQLANYKAGARKNPVMNAQAAALTDQDMKDLAAHFSGQKMQPGVASPEALKVATRLWRAGDAARGLPACSACHGPAGAGNAAAGYPRLGGQHAKYVAGALRGYRDGSTMPLNQAPAAMMGAVAAKLTDAEIEALASYVNGLH